MRFSSVFTSIVLAGSLVSSTSAILTRHTRNNLPKNRYQNVGSTSSFLRYRDLAGINQALYGRDISTYVTSRDVADIVDQILVERGLVWDAEDAYNFMERTLTAPDGPGGNGHNNGNGQGNNGKKVPPTPPNTVTF